MASLSDDGIARDRMWTPDLRDERWPVCRDCGSQIRVNAHSHLTTEGMSRTVCDECYRFRAAKLLVFDPRSRAELERAIRAEALAKGVGR